MANVGFTRRRLGVVGIVLLLLGATVPAGAQLAGQPDLEGLVLASAPAGFELAPPGTPNTGRLTPAEFEGLGAGAPVDAPPGSEGFLRQWANPATGATLVVLLLRLPTEDFADEFLQGARRAVEQAGTVSRFSTGFADSFGFDLRTADGRAVIVAGSKGRYGYTVSLGNSTGEPPGGDIPIDFARQQRNRLPEVESFSGQEAAEDVAEGFGAIAATVIVLLGIGALVIAVVLVSGRRGTRSADPVPLALPGWYRDPGVAGSLRYWDGAAWTEHQAAGQPRTAPVDPLAGAPLGWTGAPAHGASTSPPPGYQAALPSGAPPLSALARGALVALAAHGLVVVTALVLSLDRIMVLDQLSAGTVGFSRVDFSDQWYALVAVAEGGTYFIAGVAFILWFRRAYRNLSSLGAFGMRFKPGWAVGGWFVPFLNFVRPKQIADEIWRGTDPTATSTNVAGPTAPAASPLLTLWWVLFLLQAIGGTIVARLATAADVSVGELRAEAVANALLEVVSVAGLVTAVLVVQRVTARHDQRRSQLVGETTQPVLRRAVAVLVLGLVLGGGVGGAFAAASLQSDVDEPQVGVFDEAEPEPEADVATAALDDEVLDYLHRACLNTDQQISALKEPESLEELASYYEQVLGALRARDAGLRAARIPAGLRGEYDTQFVEPAESSTAEVGAVFQPIIDAARAGDAATVERLGAEVPETVGQSPSAAAYAAAVGAGACASSFAPPEEGD